jgi:outer membrane protein
MWMKKYKLLSVFFLSNLHLFSQTNEKVYSLKQCVDIAIANNTQVKQSELQMQSAYIGKQQSISNLLPTLNGNIDQGINEGRSINPFTNTYINQQVIYSSYNLSAGIPLFNGLRLQNSIGQNNYAYQAGRLELQQAKETLTLNVILAYLQVLNQIDLLAQATNDAEVAKRQVERLAILYSAGAISPSQYYDLKGQWAANRLTITDNTNALETAKLTLAQLMNMQYDKNMQLEKLSIEELAQLDTTSPSSITETAMQLSIVKAAELRTKSAKKGVMAARGQYFPRLSLYGNLNTNYSSTASRDIILGTADVESGDYVNINGNPVPVYTQITNVNSEKISYSDQFKNNYSTSFGLTLQVPIFNSFQSRHAVALSKIQLKAAEVTAESTKSQLTQSAEQAYLNMKGAYERYTTLAEQVVDFSESFREIEIKFNKGAANSIDYLVAKNNIDRAKNNLIIAHYDFILRSKILDYYKGVLKF